ncbi:hypothetical protein [Haladaptatus litoreus]|uniref:hypothetical protein n=1 Tax=Haladaptatus litoreus TaxID=553468 RepID=UPI0009708810|nr:hypothetical protein [Haladaptatus litoreus]
MAEYPTVIRLPKPGHDEIGRPDATTSRRPRLSSRTTCVDCPNRSAGSTMRDGERVPICEGCSEGWR